MNGSAFINGFALVQKSIFVKEFALVKESALIKKTVFNKEEALKKLNSRDNSLELLIHQFKRSLLNIPSLGSIQVIIGEFLPLKENSFAISPVPEATSIKEEL